jgi:hypothetical protein
VTLQGDFDFALRFYRAQILDDGRENGLRGLLSSLQSQDMYLAGSFLMFLAVLTVIGMLVSDLLLAVLDPRIRLSGGAAR